MSMKKLISIFAMLALGTLAAFAQGPGQMPPGQNVVGKVTAVGKDSITVAPIMGGDPGTVNVGDTTRVINEPQPVKPSDVNAAQTAFAREKVDGITRDAV